MGRSPEPETRLDGRKRKRGEERIASIGPKEIIYRVKEIPETNVLFCFFFRKGDEIEKRGEEVVFGVRE